MGSRTYLFSAVQFVLLLCLTTTSERLRAESVCIDQATLDAQSYETSIRYSVLDGIVRFDVRLRSESERFALGRVEVYYGLRGANVVSASDLLERDFALSAPLQISGGPRLFSASFMVERRFRRVVVFISIEPTEQPDVGVFCSIERVVSIDPSDLAQGERFGEISPAQN